MVIMIVLRMTMMMMMMMMMTMTMIWEQEWMVMCRGAAGGGRRSRWPERFEHRDAQMMRMRMIMMKIRRCNHFWTRSTSKEVPLILTLTWNTNPRNQSKFSLSQIFSSPHPIFLTSMTLSHLKASLERDKEGGVDQLCHVRHIHLCSFCHYPFNANADTKFWVPQPSQEGKQ